MSSTLSRTAAVIVVLLVAVPGYLLAQGPGGNDPSARELFLSGQSSHPNPPLWTLWGVMPMEELVDVVPHLPDDADSDFWIVQFDGPVQTSLRTSLAKIGITVLEYLPDYAYVVRLNGNRPELLLTFDNFVGAMPFLSGLKMRPELYGALSSGAKIPDISRTSRLLVDLFQAEAGSEGALKGLCREVVRASDRRFLIGPELDSFKGLASIEGLRWVEPEPLFELDNNVSRGIAGADSARSNLGLRGAGQTVAIADTGLDTGIDNRSLKGDMMADFDNRITFANWAGTSPDDTYGHGTHVAGSVAGNGSLSNGRIVGMAPLSNIFFQGIATDSGSLSLPANLSLIFQQAYDNGARVHTNSWGAPVYGQYTQSSWDVDWFLFTHPDMIILFSAGNSGMDYYKPWGTYNPDGKIDEDSIGSPGTAKNCITVGASEVFRTSGGYQFQWGTGSWLTKYSKDPVRTDKPSNNTRGLAAFSSRGPTDDGRLKPDIVAPGTNILSTKSTKTSSTGWGPFPGNSNYIYMGGTSMACPITAGGVALIREYFNRTLGMDSPSGALLKAALINGAVDLTPGQYGAANPVTKEINRRPDNDQGWGRMNVSESVSPKNAKMTFLDIRSGISTAENLTTSINVRSGSTPLRLTLVWSDYPGATYAAKELVNDLDIIVTAPDGTVYYGNDLTSPYNDARDSINPVEGIAISAPSTGTYKVVIRGFNVPMGPQHFSVVASGDISNFSGIVRLDHQYYSTDGDKIGIELFDQDAAGSGQVYLNLTSTSFPAGRKVKMVEVGSSGRFLGGIWTSNSTTSNLSRLYVKDEDVIKAVYTDKSPKGDFNDTAIAKAPQRIFLRYRPDYGLVHSSKEKVHLEGSGETGITAWWKFEGLSSEWRYFHDDGNGTFGDDASLDGNYSDIWYVPTKASGTFPLVIKVADPFLGTRYYPQFEVAFNTSMPRFPKDLSAEALPEGNTVRLTWALSNESDISKFNIYINSSIGGLGPGSLDWALIGSTEGIKDNAVITGLVDGVTYGFRVSAIDVNGNESSLSIWSMVTPLDTTPPMVNMMTTPRTIVGEITFTFSGSPDLAQVEMQYYNDSNGNGLEDDGGWMTIGNGTPSAFEWDTSIAGGGPGDIDRMFLRFRGYDEVPNISEWTNATGFRIDNTGPRSVEIIDPPPRVTKYWQHMLSGAAESDGWVNVTINGEWKMRADCNGIGGFNFIMNLTEGYNVVVLSAFDQFGAGPTNRTYEFTLDTLMPVSMIDLEDQASISRNINRDGHWFNSTSYDRGLDANFTYIENVTWTIEAPDQTIVGFFGMEELLFKFDSLGLFNITMTIRDPAQNINSTRVQVRVHDSTPPVAGINGPLIVDEKSGAFYSYNVSDNDEAWHTRWNSSIIWNFTGPEDFMEVHTTPTVVISFPIPGLYSVTLTVTDGGGNTGSITSQITVKDKNPPRGNILGPPQVTLGIPAVYAANVTDNDPTFPEGASYSWNLSFLEGPPNEWWWVHFNGTSFEYNFTRKGLYSLTLMVLDRSGNLLEVQLPIDAVGDLTPPTILEIIPAQDDSYQFSENLVVAIRFSEPMDPSTMTSKNIHMLGPGDVPVNITISLKDGTNAVVTPELLQFGTRYRLEVLEDIKDLFGNRLGEVWTVNYTIRTLFSLDWSGVFPRHITDNFTGNETDVYNITLRFTNPVSTSSLVNAVKLIAIKTEMRNGYPRTVREPVTAFSILPGEDTYSAVVLVGLDPGLRYNITITTDASDIFDYPLDRDYKWDFVTYLPPKPIGPDDDDEEPDNGIPDWMEEPSTWVLAGLVLLIIVALIIFLAVLGRVRRRKKLEKIWLDGADKAPRRKPSREQPPESPVETMTTPPQEEIYETPQTPAVYQPPPSYEDLYGNLPTEVETGPVKEPARPAKAKVTLSPEFAAPPDIDTFLKSEGEPGRSKGKKVDWDEDSEDEESWEEEEDEEEDWEIVK